MLERDEMRTHFLLAVTDEQTMMKIDDLKNSKGQLHQWIRRGELRRQKMEDVEEEEVVDLKH